MQHTDHILSNGAKQSIDTLIQQRVITNVDNAREIDLRSF